MFLRVNPPPPILFVLLFSLNPRGLSANRVNFGILYLINSPPPIGLISVVGASLDALDQNFLELDKEVGSETDSNGYCKIICMWNYHCWNVLSSSLYEHVI